MASFADRLRLRCVWVPAAVLLALAAASPPSAGALPRTNPADKLLRVPVDELRYEHAKRCRKQMTKGALALAEWLGRNTRGEYWGGLRCERLGSKSYSMHAEGRAVDWHLDAGDPADRREASRLLRLLFGRDRDGNENALARRMGVIEAIWDCRYYGYWMEQGQSRRYSPCLDSRDRLDRHVDTTLAHRNHIHFSMSWSGARMRTSYWKYLWLKEPLPDPGPNPFDPAPEPQPAPPPVPQDEPAPDPQDESDPGAEPPAFQ